MKVLVARVAGAAILFHPTAALTQTADPASVRAADQATKEAVEDETNRGARLLSSGAPNDRAVSGFSEANAQITSEDGEDRLSVAFGIDLESARAKPSATKAGFYTFTRTKIGIVASAPIDDDKIKAGLVSGDSLVDGTKVKLSITRFSNELGDGDTAFVYQNAAFDRCIREAIGEWKSSLASDRREAGERPAQAYLAATSDLTAKLALSPKNGSYVVDLINVRTADAATASAAARDTTERAAAADDTALAAEVEKQCSPYSPNRRFASTAALVTRYGDVAAFKRAFFSNRSNLLFFGADASLGSKDYEYLDRTAFALAKASKTSWEVGVYGGFFNSDLTFSLRGRAVYGSMIKEGDEAKICHAVPGEAEEHCVTGADGKPVRKKTGLLSLETRHVLSVTGKTKIALAPQFTYRFDDDEYGAELPIYLAPDENGKLNGGFKLAYASKEDEFSIGLFVGVPFSIFYQ